jgi:hypothetical protein
MRVMKVEEFTGWGNQHAKLVKFVNDNKIKQEDIVMITYTTGNYLFYFTTPKSN